MERLSDLRLRKLRMTADAPESVMWLHLYRSSFSISRQLRAIASNAASDTRQPRSARLRRLRQ